MQTKDIERKMQTLHYRLNAYNSIKGTILLRDNGLHISSTIKKPESLKLAAIFAGMFKTVKRIEDVDEAQFRLNNGLSLYMKELPSKKVILTALSDEPNSRNVKALMNFYSRMFQNIF
ncbi:MAG: hypothetical protein EAX96_04965 [Candidatus Lokiarchaeota archaeon]|nr:hypothetical protein [Candidatus Lokiarchaeota archaeon]